MSLPKLQVISLSDWYNCEQCGGGAGSSGYRVELDGKVIVNLIPRDHCFDPVTYNETNLVAAICAHFGQTVEMLPQHEEYPAAADTTEENNE